MLAKAWFQNSIKFLNIQNLTLLLKLYVHASDGVNQSLDLLLFALRGFFIHYKNREFG